MELNSDARHVVNNQLEMENMMVYRYNTVSANENRKLIKNNI